MSDQNPMIDHGRIWKLTSIGLFLVVATALATGVVVAHYAGGDRPVATSLGDIPDSSTQPAPWQRKEVGQSDSAAVSQEHMQEAPAAAFVPPTPHVEQAQQVAPATRPRPSRADIRYCNRYAGSHRSRTSETLSNALIGGALGAGLGAAGGAIAGGGGGAGKGAGIGGLVGAAAGTVYGLNKANQRDAEAAVAYQHCMRERGYVE